MKRWKKWMFMVIMAGTVALSGCGQKNTSGQSTTTTASEKSVAVSETGAEVSAESSEQSANNEGTQAEAVDVATVDFIGKGELLTGLHHVDITVKDYGVISLELDADTAPISTTNFICLARDGFYDGLTFHRIMDGFMIQGGDPLGNGTGGAEWEIRGEFDANGIPNKISHKRGVISMARAKNMDSASSQFFIVQADSDFLDGQYAGFGHVTEGLDIVDAICKDAPVVDDNGTVMPENQPIIEKITVVD